MDFWTVPNTDFTNDGFTRLLTIIEVFSCSQSRYGKAYKNEAQEAIARHNWQINHNMITDHNHEAMAGRHLYTLDENRFCDLVRFYLLSLFI